MADAIRYAQHRHGEIAFAVRTPAGAWGWHQVALLTRGDERVSVAILTHLDGSHAYGKETPRGIAIRLLEGLSRR